MSRESLSEESFYELLRVNQSATTAEIVNAYHAAKSAYSKDSIATYSLFEQGDTETILAKLEEAYLTLSSIEKRRDYDKLLHHTSESPNEAPMNLNPHSLQNDFPKENSQSLSAPPTPPSQNSTAAAPAAILEMTDTTLATLREGRGLTLEDVSRITKIPTKFLRAIEIFDLKKLPAKVYIQGFLKNLCQLYRIDQKETLKQYLEELDKRLGPKPN